MENKNNINSEEHKSCACNGGCCGHEHTENSHGCGCGSHDSHGGCGCSGGCCGGGCGHHQVINIEDLSEDQNAFLHYLSSYAFLPVTRFVVKSSKENDFLVQALAPVYIQYKDDTMEQVKFISNILLSLEEKGLVSIDYDMKLENYDYSEYYDCDLYKLFVSTVEEGKTKQNFLGDIADIETGSIALTELYEDLM